MEKQFRTFEDLEVWKTTRELRKAIAKLARRLPAEERFILVPQILRSSRSVTANIAEGHGRYHYQENIQFCRISRGSLSETMDHITCAYDDGYISEQELNEFRQKYLLCLRMLNGYILYLRDRKKSEQQNHS